MNDNEIKKIIAQELENGKSLSQIQDLLNGEHGTRLTFLDVRLLAAEVESIDWKSFEESPDSEEDDKSEDVKDDEKQAVNETGMTKIDVSSLVRPGAMTHGTVTFKSGSTAEWILENTGRLGLDKVVGQPTEEDLADFQVQLQQLLTHQ